MKPVIFLWLLLLALTVLTTRIPTLAENFLSPNTVVPLVLLATLVKGHIVIDHFMALKRVGGAWRWIVPGWLLLVLGLIGYAFH
jgi:hypothetical protein